MKRNFPIGAVLSVAGEKLMCDIGRVYEILNFMTGDNLFTHQLPRAAVECRPFLMAQHPWLSEYVQSIQHQVNTDTYRAILADCEARWGKEVAIEELSAVEGHAFKDPAQELSELISPDRMIVIEAEDDGSL